MDIDIWTYENGSVWKMVTYASLMLSFDQYLVSHHDHGSLYIVQWIIIITDNLVQWQSTTINVLLHIMYQ